MFSPTMTKNRELRIFARDFEAVEFTEYSITLFLHILALRLPFEFVDRDFCSVAIENTEQYIQRYLLSSTFLRSRARW